ncbi:MAG: hypothetical protein Aurels2KO_35780 [Aureliella sp.]
MPSKRIRQTRLSIEFYQADTVAVARQLLGKVLVRRLGGRVRRAIIVETEAYLASGDPASHSYCGPTRRNATMFNGPGMLYVYTIHQQHCMNVVTEPAGSGAAVLLRAAEPIEGIDHMLAARSISHDATGEPPRALVRRCTQGPGRLCSAFEIDLANDKTDLIASEEIWLEDAPSDLCSFRTQSSRRVGISKGVERRLRFFADGNYFVSGCARDHTAGRNRTFQ